MKTRWLILVGSIPLVFAGWAGAAPAALETLWQIGKPDNSTAEFALAPDRYGEFPGPYGDPDDLYFIGHSDPKRDWPYVLPGTVDEWAGASPWGGNRMWILPIGFELEGRPPAQPCRLTVDFADTQAKNPPLFRIWINDHPHDFQLPPGGGDASIRGDLSRAKEYLLHVEIPPGELEAGFNRIALTIQRGSWVLFDAITFEAPPGVQLAPKRDTVVRSVKPAAFGTKSKGGSAISQTCLVDVQQFDRNATLTVSADDVPCLTPTVEPGRTILEAPLPAVAATGKAGTATIRVRAGNELLYSGSVTRSTVPEASPADYVDVFMGTAHSRWMIAPGPWMPFGMVKLSPDNEDQHWLAGYDYSLEHINGFSHIHEWTMAGLLMMPTTGPLRTQPGTEAHPTAGYSSRFDKSSERGGLGYYSVFLKDYGIRAELTATTRAGLQRYTFPQTNQARVLVDLLFPAEYGFQVEDAVVRRVSDTEIEGSSKQSSKNVWFPGDEQLYTVHFVLQFSKPFESMGGWVGSKITTNTTEIKGAGDVGAFVNFTTTRNETVLVRSGLSLVSTENARLNLDRELAGPFGWNFQAVVDHQRRVWNDIFSRVEIETDDYREKVRFYSNLYRAYCARNTWSDVNGQWCDPSEQIRTLPDPASPVYGCDAFWNTFWNLNPLWILLTPRVAGNWVRSELALYDAGGWLAKGPAGMEYISVMVAEHEIPLLVATYQAGVRDFDVAKLYQAVIKMQTTLPQKHPSGGYVGNENLEPYLKYGYVPYGEKSKLGHSQEKWLTSNTLEYSYDDWTVAQFAQALGETIDCQIFRKRAENWRNIFDPATGFMRPKKEDGTWLEPFDPYHTPGFTEGNAWQYTWFVPQNVPGLIAAMGRERFVNRLNEAMEKSSRTRFNATGEHYELFPINHGNQPTMQVGWLFNYAGRPWLSQKWVRAILDRYYGYGPQDAYLGDEDQGQMSAWFVMAALGLFQIDGGCRVDPVYEIASPLYPKVALHFNGEYGRGPGKTFTIEARNASRKNQYIQSATLNGRELDSWWFFQKDLFRGGSLVLEMGPEPNPHWGAAGGPNFDR
jgi:predicted alpha-1,2-mannosidase